MLRGHGSEASLTDDHAWLTSIVGYTLSIGSHMFYLLKRELDDAYWMRASGERLNERSSLGLVSDSIEAHGNVLGVQTHQAVCMVNDVTSLIFGLEGDSSVWERLPVNCKLVESIDQLLHHLDVGSVGSSAVESSVPVIKDYGTFSFESHTSLLKMS